MSKVKFYIKWMINNHQNIQGEGEGFFVDANDKDECKKAWNSVCQWAHDMNRQYPHIKHTPVKKLLKE